MKKKWTIVFRVFLLALLGISLVAPAESYAVAEENDVGIRFTRGSSNSSQPSSSDSSTEPGVTKPMTKPEGRLPSTGELMQPVILLLVGWLVVIIGTAIFLSSKKANREEG